METAEGHARGTGSTHSAAARASEQARGSSLSCGLSAARQKQPRLRLQDRDQLACEDVRFVLGSLIVAELSLVALAGQRVQAGANGGVRPEARQLARGFSVQRRADGIKEAFEDVTIRFFHTGIIHRLREKGSLSRGTAGEAGRIR